MTVISPDVGTAGTTPGASHPLVVVSSADELYSMPLAVMLYSALMNYRGSRPVEIYVLDGGISAASKQRIQKVVAPFGARLTWLTPRLDLLSDVPQTDTHCSVSTYFRLFVPELLPPHLTRALYLDSDMVVRDDLARLWEQEVGDNYLLAVPDATTTLSHLAPCPELTIREGDRYFNAGVLVMDLSRWRRDGFGRKVLEFVRTWRELIRYDEQDALNARALGRWGTLDRVWNQFIASSVAMEKDFKLLPGGIIHYIGPVKPWHPQTARFRQPSDVRAAHRLFEKYARESGWFTSAEWLRFAAQLRLRRFSIGYVGLPLRVLSIRARTLAGRLRRRTSGVPVG